MAMFDVDVGYDCDHLVRYFIILQPTGNPNEFTIPLQFALPPANTGNEQFTMFRNEVAVLGLVFLRGSQPKVVTVQQLSAPAVFPVDDFELQHTTDPSLCPKCKAQSNFGL